MDGEPTHRSQTYAEMEMMMYSTDPEWCNVHWKHVGRLECMDCLQATIEARIDELILYMIIKGWEWPR